jgi:hypothetical protein
MLSQDVVSNGHAAPEPARTLDIEIDPPVDANGRTWTMLHLEEPTARMIERAEAELAGAVNMHTMRKYQIALVSQCSGAPRAVVEQMRISQVREAADFLSSFIAAGPPTGET